VVKLTLKQEAFCLAYIETGNATEAYRQSYSTENMKPATVNRNAKTLTDNNKIIARLAVLQAEHRERHNVTVDSLTGELDEARLLALLKELPAAAVSASMGKAKIHGLLIDKQERAGPDGGPQEHNWTVEFVNAAPVCGGN
jgi:phage terminase small subunit